MQNAVCPHVLSTDSPPRVTLASTCSAPVHFILSGHGSHPRLAPFLPPPHSRPAYSSLSALPNSLLLHENPPFFFLFSAVSCGLSPATFPAAKSPDEVPVREVRRSNEGHARFCWPRWQRARPVMELWVAGKLIFFFFYMSHCKVISWKFSNVPNALSSLCWDVIWKFSCRCRFRAFIHYLFSIWVDELGKKVVPCHNKICEKFMCTLYHFVLVSSVVVLHVSNWSKFMFGDALLFPSSYSVQCFHCTQLSSESHRV